MGSDQQISDALRGFVVADPDAGDDAVIFDVAEAAVLLEETPEAVASYIHQKQLQAWTVREECGFQRSYRS